jgi:hypothetical protein
MASDEEVLETEIVETEGGPCAAVLHRGTPK